jgi:glycosyl transferase, family 25
LITSDTFIAVRCYVINLPRSVDRRRHMEEQMRGFDAEFIDAFDGATANLDGLEPAQWMTPPLIGDALSHIEAYRRILAAGAAHGCVFEDDATVTPATRGVIDRIAEVLRGRSVALLHYRGHGGMRLATQPAIDLGDGHRLLEPVSEATTGTGYVITREACEGLLGLLPVLYGPDAWGAFREHGGIDRILCVYPQVVSAETRFASTIGYGGRLAKFVPARLRARRRARIQRDFGHVELVE